LQALENEIVEMDKNQEELTTVARLRQVCGDDVILLVKLTMTGSACKTTHKGTAYKGTTSTTTMEQESYFSKIIKVAYRVRPC